MGNYRGGEEPRQLTGHSSHYSNMPLGFSAEACWASPHTLLSHKQRHASPFLKTQTITDRCFLANRSSLGQFQGQKRVCRLYSELNMMRSHICFCGICGGENQVSEHTARCGRLTRRRWSVQAGEVRRSAEGGGAGGVGWGGVGWGGCELGSSARCGLGTLRGLSETKQPLGYNFYFSIVAVFCFLENPFFKW